MNDIIDMSRIRWFLDQLISNEEYLQWINPYLVNLARYGNRIVITISNVETQRYIKKAFILDELLENQYDVLPSRINEMMEELLT